MSLIIERPRFRQNMVLARLRRMDYRLMESVSVEDFPTIQNAIDAVSLVGGGEVVLPAGVFVTGPLVLKNRVVLRGAGRGATVLKLADGSNADLLTISADAALIGWRGITFDGNAAGNASGRCIVAEATGASDGSSFAPYSAGADSPPESYKHLIAYDFVAGNAAGDGVVIGPSNFQVFFDNFAVSHCGGDGLAISSSDGIYSNFYAEKNGRCGLYASGSNNKFSNGKVIWNGRVDNTFGGLREQGSANQFIGVEAQDNYCDGLVILGNGPVFHACTANTNGYLSVGNEDKSSGIHADIRVGASANGIVFNGRAYTYKTAVGTDALWTTQWPYYFNAFSAGQITQWQVEFDQAKYNAAPNVAAQYLTRNKLGEIGMFSTDGVNTFLDFSPKSLTGAGNKTVRVWRGSEASGTCQWSWYSPGTAIEQHRFTGTGDTLLNQVGGNVTIGNAVTGGAWNTGHARLGPYRLWVDAAGRLRIKNGAPASDTDGAIVGAQA